MAKGRGKSRSRSFKAGPVYGSRRTSKSGKYRNLTHRESNYTTFGYGGRHVRSGLRLSTSGRALRSSPSGARTHYTLSTGGGHQFGRFGGSHSATRSRTVTIARHGSHKFKLNGK